MILEKANEYPWGSGVVMVKVTQKIGPLRAASIAVLSSELDRRSQAATIWGLRQDVRSFIKAETSKRYTKKWRGKRFNLDWRYGASEACRAR